MKKQVLMIVMFIVFVTSVIFSQDAIKKATAPDLEKQLEKVFFEANRLDRPGQVVVVVKEGKVLLKKAFGLAVLEHELPVTTNTLFDVVTISQPFTAMAITMLEKEGKLSLKDDIRKYLPELPQYGKTIDFARGWEIDKYKGLEQFSVKGAWGGYNVAMRYFPRQQCGFLLLSNWVSFWVNPDYTLQSLVDIYLEKEFAKHNVTKPTQTSKNTEEQEQKKVSIDPELLEKYLGDYRWRPGYVVKLVKEQTGIYIQFPNLTKIALTPEADNIFIDHLHHLTFTFVQSTQGAGMEMVVKQNETLATKALKIRVVKPTVEKLKEFTGDYLCPPLKISYRVALQNDKLVIMRQRNSDIPLVPESENCFNTDMRLFPIIEFLRDAEKKVTGFKIFDFPLTFERI